MTSRPKNATPGFLEEMIVRACEKQDLDADAALELHEKYKEAASNRENRQYPRILDPRYPNHNQNNHCWARYNEYLQCLKDTDGDDQACWEPKFLMRSICPLSWQSEWQEQRESGTFPGVTGAPIIEEEEEDDE